MKEYGPEDILKLVSLRTAILRAKGHSQEEIEKDIQGYVEVLNDPTKHWEQFEKFVEGQFWIYERTKGTWE